MPQNLLILDLSKVYLYDRDLVGRKAYELGILWNLGIPLAKGFVLTTKFYKAFLEAAGLEKEISKIMNTTHPSLHNSLDKLLETVSNNLLKFPIPDNLSKILHAHYRSTFGILKEKKIILTSSGSSYKSVEYKAHGDANLIIKIKSIFSMNLKGLIAIIIQEELNVKTKGKVITDSCIEDGRLTSLQMKMLNNYCKLVQKHFYFPKELEYALVNDKLIITKILPFTGVIKEKNKDLFLDEKPKKTIIKGLPLNPGIVTGPVKIIHHMRNLKIKREEIAILSTIENKYFYNLRNAKAIIIDSPLRDPIERALLRNKFQIPTIIGVKEAIKKFRDGNIITVNAISGEIYSGGLVY